MVGWTGRLPGWTLVPDYWLVTSPFIAGVNPNLFGDIYLYIYIIYPIISTSTIEFTKQFLQSCARVNPHLLEYH